MSESAVHDGVARLARAPHLLVALDFDGTLAPLRPDPATVTMAPGADAALAALARAPRTTLALVSGRPLAQLAALASPPPGTVLVGSHGAESGRIDSEGRLDPVPSTPSEQELATLARLDVALADITLSCPGTWVEHKEFARVLHTRRAEASSARRATVEVLAGPATWEGVHPMSGKAVVELAVRNASKGEALAALRDAVANACGLPVTEVTVLFAGDDATDETALVTLSGADLGVKVGDGASAARVRVADEKALVALLDELASTLAIAGAPPAEPT